MGKAKKTAWKKGVRREDNFVSDPQPDDLVIIVMGPTGVGKSTFINTLFGKDVATVGHNLQSQTQQLQHYIYPDPHRRIIIVDTPGFDDTYVDDREILRRIAIWLARCYDADMKIAGLLYLHNVNERRMTGSQVKNFSMFRKICGDGVRENIMLITTSWESGVSEESRRRQQQQVQKEDQLRKGYWKDLVSHGSRMRRFESTMISAQGIIKDILARKAISVVQIQSELVMIDKLLAETEAGRTLLYTLQELLETQKKNAKDPDASPEEIIESDNNIRSLLQQIKALNVPISVKLKRFFGL